MEQFTDANFDEEVLKADKPVIVETMNLHSFGYVSLVRLSE